VRGAIRARSRAGNVEQGVIRVRREALSVECGAIHTPERSSKVLNAEQSVRGVIRGQHGRKVSNAEQSAGDAGR
jgi:hypothetical protein